MRLFERKLSLFLDVVWICDKWNSNLAVCSKSSNMKPYRKVFIVVTQGHIVENDLSSFVLKLVL